MKLKITAALVKAPPPIPAGARKLRISDTELPGFVMEVWPSGGTTFWCRYTDQSGRSREIKIGKSTSVSVEQARRKAKDLRVQVALTGDPAADRDKRRAVPTFEAFVTQQYLPFAKEQIRSYRDHESFCRLRLIPWWGTKRLDEVKTTDVVELQRRLREEGLSTATVNRYVVLAKRIFNVALGWEVYEGRNPCQRVKLSPEQGRETFLTVEELRRLFQALDAEPSRSPAACLVLMALTGCRKGEALGARFDEIDLSNQIWTVPASRSKSKRIRRIPLSAAAVQLLQSLPARPDCPWLFPNAAGDGHIENVRRCWERVRRAAGLPPARPHDLRHTYASQLAQNGQSLYLISTALGHASPQMTSRYAHFANDALIQAADVVGRLAALPKPAAE